MSRFIAGLADSRGLRIGGYSDLHRWSVGEVGPFWESVWSFCGILGSRGSGASVEGLDRMPGARWFPGAHLNCAENLLAGPGDEPAIFFRNERGERRVLSRGELRNQVSSIAAGLRECGVAAGDRVAAIMPNVPETVAAMLASASLGAIWSSCSPDFGNEAVLDRLTQVKPKVLFTVDGYPYKGIEYEMLPRVREITAHLAELRATFVFPYLGREVRLDGLPRGIDMAEILRGSREAPSFVQLPFDHPLFIMFSSGTTGKPKCIVHSAGGTLLQHRKEHVLHTDIGPGDRVFYFTTCGWMMWNWLASCLASGAAIVLYDGSPAFPSEDILWEVAETEGVTVFGTSAAYLRMQEKAGVRPAQGRSLERLRTILSTGSPLAPESFDYVYREVKEDVCLSSISGGTDIISCFALGNPILPVYRGELQCLGLGMNVEVFDESGRPCVGTPGELCCTAPFPSMPLGFLDDPEDRRYRAAYFERFPGAWSHGDWATLTERGGMVIHGRSDATLNPGGVRIGTAEIYGVVEKIPEVAECAAVTQDWDGDLRIALFVVLRTGVELDEALRDRIRRRLRTDCSPRHVPAKIVAVTGLPRTTNGKMAELAIRETIHGRPVTNRDALQNPEVLRQFENLEELRTG